MAKNKNGQETNDQTISRNNRRAQLSVGKFIPKDWERVRVTRTKTEDNIVVLRIRRLVIQEA